MSVLQKIQRELDEQKSTIIKSGEKVTEQLTLNVNKMLEDKFSVWEEKYENLKEKVEHQEKRLYFLEKQARQTNIVFFGIEEKEKSYANLENEIIKFIQEYFCTRIDYKDIKEVKRLGKKGERSRPVLVSFSTLGLKIKIWLSIEERMY